MSTSERPIDAGTTPPSADTSYHHIAQLSREPEATPPSADTSYHHVAQLSREPEAVPSPAPPSRKRGRGARIAVRVMFALVFVWNVQCAILFVASPDAYASAYELSGTAGAVAMQGLGIAFLMWNATYPAVIVNPRRFRGLGIVVIVQQLIGLIGESWIRATLPAGHVVLATSVERFIIFDGIGLVLMASSFIWMTLSEGKRASED